MTTRTDTGLRGLNEKAYDLAQTIQVHPAFECLPREYQDAVNALFEWSQDVHMDHDAVLDFGREDGEGSFEERARDLEVDDIYLDDDMGGDPMRVVKVDFHGDSVLVTSDNGDGLRRELTLDGDELLLTIWRRDDD